MPCCSFLSHWAVFGGKNPLSSSACGVSGPISACVCVCVCVCVYVCAAVVIS